MPNTLNPEDHIAQAILRCVVYYDLFEYPLTLFELWHMLPDLEQNPKHRIAIPIQSLEQIIRTHPKLKEKLIRQDDFISLRSKPQLQAARESKQKANARHWQKTKRILSLLGLCPFVQMIGITGSQALDNSSQASDIDLLIVASHGRIWTTRAFAVLLTGVLGLYRTRSHVAGKFCLNHFLTEDHLAIDHQNLYTARQFSHVVVAFGIETYRRFQKANAWISSYIPRYPWYNFPPFRIIEHGSLRRAWRSGIDRLLSGKVGDLGEKLLKKIQLWHIQRDDRKEAPEAQVVLQDTCLRFHLQAQEPIILNKYERALTLIR